MNKLKLVGLMSVLLMFTACDSNNEPAANKPANVVMTEADKLAHIAEAKGVIKQFAMTLKGELVGAMKSGGPVNAVEVCHTQAPDLAAKMSAEHGATLTRVSLKNRNPTMGVPNKWQNKVLQDFETRLANGEAIESLKYVDIANESGGQEFRLMKAIPTGAVCLTCHGEDIKPEVQAKLTELYPNDQATGFTAGQIRGAFVYTKPL